MRLHEVLWKEKFVNKIESKHEILIEEVEEVLFSKAYFLRAQKGIVKGEDLYVAYGQTGTGRYLTVFFIFKRKNVALPISAREMTKAERKFYEQKR
ncbi:BrnT family toxin [Candidatus Saccharibacteria bacterium]|nr:BrnT family toxin [Candidatus Saccharibacteria bacterium]NIV03656.1 BrnT family toxin [Calditrichia bacterium]NIV71958.1 BrnT family toxin [Calditrichia bacterium]NIV98748.1 BrnT family toxin [Candidatus Saccharibacteria bacterium]NIW79014.1 BrnT family toxin [Calditrichia bacterium]